MPTKFDLRSFPPPEVAEDAAEAAMAFLADSDAIVVDLRRNGGGTGAMVQLLASYFFDRSVHLSTATRRRQNHVREDWTLAHFPGRRLHNVDLFVLTSR